MSALEWEAPDPRAGRGRPNVYAGIFAELAANPGEWAIVARDVSPTMVGYLKKKFAGSEVTARGRTSSGLAEKVYARYPGVTS